MMAVTPYKKQVVLKNAFHVPRSGTRSEKIRNGTERVPVLKNPERNGTERKKSGKNSFQSEIRSVPNFHFVPTKNPILNPQNAQFW